MKVIGIACSTMARSNSLRAVEAFLKGAAEAGHETELIKIEPGKWLFPFFAQGSPDEEMYVSHYAPVVKPFEGYGFKVQPPFVITRANVEDKVIEAYELGKAL